MLCFVFVDITDVDVDSIDSGRPDTPDTDDSLGAKAATDDSKGSADLETKESEQDKNPTEDNFESIKLISNGAFG